MLKTCVSCLIFFGQDFFVLSQSQGKTNAEIKNLIQTNYRILEKEYSRIRTENEDLHNIIEVSLNHSINISHKRTPFHSADHKSTVKTLEKSSLATQFCLREGFIKKKIRQFSLKEGRPSDFGSSSLIFFLFF